MTVVADRDRLVEIHDRLVVTRQRAAHVLDTSIDSINRMAARGELEKVQLGPRRVGITSRSIIALVDKA
jgi:hypothetical protein